jgi:hypothetical protein
MLSNILIAPSINSLIVTGTILLFIFIIFIMNINSFKRLNYYQKIILLSTITMAVGVHGLIHLGVEREYNFNPYKWF